jgi:hypothetical protein
MTQWPSGPRVTVVVPSGPLEVEVEVLLVLSPLVVAEPPELDETAGPLVWDDVVLPLIVVDDETLPPPTVTELESPDPGSLFVLVPLPSSTVQVSPLSVGICFADADAAITRTKLTSTPPCLSKLPVIIVWRSLKEAAPTKAGDRCLLSSAILSGFAGRLTLLFQASWTIVVAHLISLAGAASSGPDRAAGGLVTRGGATRAQRRS